MALGAFQRRTLLFALLVLGCPSLEGCGAKTGLKAPDLEEDASVPPPPLEIPCIDVPLEGGPVNVALEVEAEVGRADVVFLIDTTLSMDDEIERIRDRLRDRIAPAIREAIPDSELAVTTFADFPVRPYGLADVDAPFRLMVPRTDDVTQVQAAVDAIRLGDGRDPPESHVEALYQLATGEGLGDFVAPSFGCPTGGLGYACLRTDALPVFLLFTDAEFHNGPTGGNPYDPGLLGLRPHSYDDALGAVRTLGARVIGFDSGAGAARSDLNQLARDTETLDAAGRPLVFDIGPSGGGLDTEVVNAIRTFAGTIIQDIDALPADPDVTDSLDPLDFVEAIEPLSAAPTSGIAGIDRSTGTFLGVEAGTLLTFQVRVFNDVVVPGDEPLRIRLQIIFRGDGRNRLGVREVLLIIPAADGRGCDSITNVEE